MANLLRCLLASVFVFSGALSVVGQEPEGSGESAAKDEMETDRDSFTPATSTVGFGRALFETGYTFIDNRNVPEGHSFAESLLRLGVWDRLELRIGWNFEAGGPTGATSGTDFGAEDSLTEHASEILYGAKFETSHQSGWVPNSAVILQGYTPTSGPSNISTDRRRGHRLEAAERLAVEFISSLRHRQRKRRQLQSVGAVHRAQDSPGRAMECPRRVFQYPLRG